MRRREHHVRQFVLVRRRHRDDVRHATQIGNVKQPVVRGPVLGRKPGAVHAKNDRQVLQRHVVDDAIVRPLQKGRIYGDHRGKAHRRHAGGKQHRVFLGDSHVVIPVRHRLLQRLQPRAARHRRGDAHHGIVLLAKLHHRLPENILPGRRRPRFRRGRNPRLNVVRARAVEFLRLLDGDVVPLAFFRQHVQHHRTLAGLREFQRIHQQRQIMPVNRAEITQPHLLKYQAAAEAAAPVGFDMGRVLFQRDFRHGPF